MTYVGSLKMAVSRAQVHRPLALLSADSEAKNNTNEAWKYNVLCSCGYAAAVLPSCLWVLLAFSSQGPPEARVIISRRHIYRFCFEQMQELPRAATMA